MNISKLSDHELISEMKKSLNAQKEMEREFIQNFFQKNKRRKTLYFVVFEDSIEALVELDEYPLIFKGIALAERYCRQKEHIGRGRYVVGAIKTEDGISTIHSEKTSWRQGFKPRNKKETT